MPKGGKRENSGPKSYAEQGLPKKEVFALRLSPEVRAWAETQRRHIQNLIEQEYRLHHSEAPEKPLQRD